MRFLVNIHRAITKFNKFKADNTRKWKQQVEADKKEERKKIGVLPKHKELYYKFIIEFLNFWDGSNYGSILGMVGVFYISFIFFMYLIFFLIIFHVFSLDINSNIFSQALIFCYISHLFFSSFYKTYFKKSKITMCGKIKNYYRKKLRFQTFEQEPSRSERFHKRIKY